MTHYITVFLKNSQRKTFPHDFEHGEFLPESKAREVLYNFIVMTNKEIIKQGGAAGAIQSAVVTTTFGRLITAIDLSKL